MNRVLVCAFAALLMTGCSLWPFRSEPERHVPTLAEVIRQPTRAKASRLPSLTLLRARDAYEKVLADPPDRKAVMESLQNLARIEGILAENALAENRQDAMQSHLDAAASYYRRLLSEFADSIDTTEVQYQLARVLALGGQVDDSYQLLQRLAATGQKRIEGIEARFRLAETAFSSAHYKEAEKLYSEVVDAGRSGAFYATALYKRGWSRFKQGAFDRARNDFSDLLMALSEGAAEQDGQRQGLWTDTVRILALSLSYLDGPQAARKHFARIGHQPWEVQVYKALAQLYQEQERFQDTAKTYLTFVEANPYAPEAPDLDSRAIDVLEKAGFVDLVLQAKARYVERYRLKGTYWTTTGRKRPDEVAGWMREHLNDLTAYYHARAQDMKKPSAYMEAARWYRLYLEEFPHGPDAAEKRWLLAEVLHDAGQNNLAAEQYRLLAYGDKERHPSRAEEAGYRWVLVLQENLLKAVREEDKKRLRQAVIEAGLAYAKAFPQSKRVTSVLLDIMEWQIANGDVAASVKTATGLLSRKDLGDKADRVRAVIADGWFDMGDYAQAEQAIGLVLKMNRLNKKEKQRFHRLRGQAIYKQGEQAQKQGSLEEAIRHYLRLAKVEPKAPERLQAEYDAATLMLELKSYSQAVGLLTAFEQRYPGHPLARNIPAKLIVAYEAMGNFRGAARIYQKMAAREKDPKVRRVALWQAADSWMKVKGSDARKQAIALWKQYVKAFPKPEELALEAQAHLVHLYDAEGVAWKRDFWRRKLVRFVRDNKLKDSRARTLAAEAQLALANLAMAQFRSVRIKAPLAKTLKAKRNAMKKALKAYGIVIELGVRPMATEAGFHVGEAYALLARELMQSPRPKGLSELELEEYNALLEEKVYPFEDKAIEAFEAQWQLTRQGVWDVWMRKTWEALKTLMPARYNKSIQVDNYDDAA
jgi:tetratricopeptide (TPR) repeat protein